MRTTRQLSFGDPSVIEIVETDLPEPDFGQVRIAVHAAGVNPVDVHVRAGSYPLLGEPPFTLGWDVAGVVDAVAPGISAFAVGDRVLGLVGFPAAAGTHADYVVADHNQLVAVPESLGIEEAGALPMAGLTAWQAVVGIAGVGPGDTVLVPRAAGGVGHLAVQIAAARGARVIAVATAAKHELLRDLGAAQVVDYTTEDVASAVSGVDVVLDLLGGEHAATYAGTLRPGGLFVPVMPGNVDEAAAAALGVRYAGLLVRPSAADLRSLAELVALGRLRVLVQEALPLADVAKAHELVGGGHVTGKVVLVP